jgi:hypothetical protein
MRLLLFERHKLYTDLCTSVKWVITETTLGRYKYLEQLKTVTRSRYLYYTLNTTTVSLQTPSENDGK